MATQQYRIVSGANSEIHEEPHIEGSRVTVRDVVVRVEERGRSPARVAARYTLDIADVYEALAYYHNNPEAMRAAERRHETAETEAKRRSTLTPPDSDESSMGIVWTPYSGMLTAAIERRGTPSPARGG